MSGIHVRPATMQDVEPILDLVNELAQQQVMLPRSPSSVLEGIRDYVIAEDERGFLGCGALHVAWSDLAEVRSLAVSTERQKGGVGRAIVDRLVQDAEQLGIAKLFAFTYVPGFFERLGFRFVEHEKLPHKVFKDCLHCPKFMSCDEIAMERELDVAAPVNLTFGSPMGAFPMPRSGSLSPERA